MLHGPELTHEVLDAFAALHTLAWRDRGGSRALAKPRTMAFHHALLDQARDSDLVAMAVLRVGGLPLAMRYGFLLDGVFHGYLSAFDPAFSRYSPGMLGVLKTAEAGAGEGWHELDMMRGDETYKFLLTHQVRHSVNHYVAKSPRWLRVVRLLEGLS